MSMKRVIQLLIFSLLLISCDLTKESNEATVLLSFNIDKDTYSNYGSSIYYEDGDLLKSSATLKDTNSFILKVYSTNGAKVYNGKYGNRPKDFYVMPGGYDISLLSGELNKPSFVSPVFGDSTTIIVGENEQINVKLSCKQLSGGVRFNFTKEFKEKFYGSGVHIEQGGNRLFYGYDEKSYAYLGDDYFSLIYSSMGKDTTLLTKAIQPYQMVTMNLSYLTSKGDNSHFSVDFDTSRTWINNNYNIALRIPTGVYTIEEAKRMVGQKNIPVFGFIYGGDPTNNTVRIKPPFTSTASFVIAPSMAERDRNNSFVVELPSGTIRDKVNLVAYPGNLGRAVVVTGEIVPSYFNYIGVKGTKDYFFLN